MDINSAPSDGGKRKELWSWNQDRHNGLQNPNNQGGTVLVTKHKPFERPHLRRNLPVHGCSAGWQQHGISHEVAQHRVQKFVGHLS